MLSIGIWDRFEVTIKSSQIYKNPYFDVELKASFFSPDGRNIEVLGFYDGDQNWKIRFMPDKKGKWEYRSFFSDGTLASRGEFMCTDSEIPGLISKDEINSMWFGFKGGKHILIRSFHAGDRFFASNWPKSERTKFLDWIQQNKYNMLSIASHYLNRRQPGRGDGWDTPALWKNGQPDAAEFSKMEAILDEISKRRILVFPFAGFFGRKSNYPVEPKEQTLFIKYTIARLGAYWNILLNVAGPEPLNLEEPYMAKEQVDILGMEIQRFNTAGHLVTVHNRDGGVEDYRNEAYISFSTLQGLKTTNRYELYKTLLNNRIPDSPLYAQETLWSNNLFHPAYTKEDIRKNAFVINMSAAALNFADNQGDSSTGFSGTLNPEDALFEVHEIIKKVWDFFETVEFYRMRPHPELTSIGCCLAEEGQQYLVYLESGGCVDVALGQGEYSVTWINARNPDERVDGGKTMDGMNLKAPDRNDWLVHLVKM